MHPVATIDQLPPGALLGVTLPDETGVCLTNLDGELCAVANTCTHQEFALSSGVLHADGSIECLWHGARFDCRTGAVRRGPATRPVATYRVEVSDGRILVGRYTDGAGHD
jgi:nitrite reductase/ring-hydroxylating ferredoxin subunit